MASFLPGLSYKDQFNFKPSAAPIMLILLVILTVFIFVEGGLAPALQTLTKRATNHRRR